MDIQNAIYGDADGNSINALIDGTQMSVPVKTGNRHYDAIIEQGIDVAPYAAPPPKTDAEVDEEMDARMDDPFILSLIDALAPKLTGPTDVETIRTDMKEHARKPGRVPRNRE